MKFEPLPWPGAAGMPRFAPAPRHIALLGNFPPRRCGLATYTADSWSALIAAENAPRVDVYAMDDGQVEGYVDDIMSLIPQNDISAYLAAADAIDASGADMLWIQHEYGIFGGEAGSHLLALLNRVRVPVAVTLHTILDKPNGDQRSVMDALLARASTIIVMAEKGRDILHATHDIDPARITVIPHGIPDCRRSSPVAARAKLGLPERPTVLTFGLLSPDKGIADMIEAMLSIVEAVPDTHYIVLGATHPHLVRREGETYRESLQIRIAELGLEKSISLVDRFVDLDELTGWLAAADVYVTPYRNPAQITSGTLSYAIGLGKAVVSTPYVHASEILADDHGKIVGFEAPADLAAAVGRLLANPDERDTISARAYARGRSMIWSRNAEAVLTAMARGRRRHHLPVAKRALPTLSIVPIERMTDGTGMLQHSILGVPDRRHGYCIDDNARGLLLMALADDLPAARRAALSTTYASFVQHGWNPEAKRFRNFMGYDRNWLEDIGSEDSNGRTLWAIAMAARRGPTRAIRHWALDWYDLTAGEIRTLGSPRAMAFTMLAAAEIHSLRPEDATALATLRDGANTLLALLDTASRPDWAWFEIMLAYDNTRLPEALIRAGRALGDREAVAAGLATLDWIATQTTGHGGFFQPVGTESFGEAFAMPAIFDQQPLEAWAAVDAYALAWSVTGDEIWAERATAAHDWFLGANTLSVPIIDPATGECHDGLTRFDVNLNQGAESVIAWQAARRAWLAAFGGLSESDSALETAAEPIAVAA